MLLKDRRVIVTGATRGIGRAVAEVFVEHGAAVLINGRSRDVHDVAAELAAKGGRVIAIQGDVRDDAHVRELNSVCRTAFGGLDVLVNNAGVLTQSVLGMTRMSAVQEMLEVNVVAMINVAQYAVRLMAKSPAASIINLASIAGTRGIKGLSAYSASKAGVVGFTLAAAKELAPRGIRVNAIAPGFIDTDMTRGLPDEWSKRAMADICLGHRIGSPREVAGCALFLASDLSSYVTGQVIGVDGGMIL